jgi:hypothetical protein
MPSAGSLTQAELEELQRLGWNVHLPAERPSEVPDEEQFPVHEDLEYILVDVIDSR